MWRRLNWRRNVLPLRVCWGNFSVGVVHLIFLTRTELDPQKLILMNSDICFVKTQAFLQILISLVMYTNLQIYIQKILSLMSYVKAPSFLRIYAKLYSNVYVCTFSFVFENRFNNNRWAISVSYTHIDMHIIIISPLLKLSAELLNYRAYKRSINAKLLRLC